MPEASPSPKTPLWVDSPSKLVECCKEFSTQTIIGVDTESNSLFAFHERTCLIQISTPDRDFLIDPLANLDISLLGATFSDPSIEKVFHAAEYDILCLKRDFCFEFHATFDTMLACRILGWKDLSLSAQLLIHFGIQADKRFQKANWGVRPLSEEQKEYATLDSHYLIPLRGIVLSELTKAGMLELAREDFAHLAAIRPQNLSEKEECANINGKGKLSPRQYTILQALCHYRDIQAQKRDVPPFKILNSSTLLDLAKNPPAALNEMIHIEGMSATLVKRHGEAILKAVEKGKKAPLNHQVKKPMPDPAYLHRLELLKQWRKAEASSLSVESDVILPRDLMEKIARENPQSRIQLAKVMEEYPWRFQRSAESILANLKGKDNG
jgi:ribonuclease D